MNQKATPRRGGFSVSTPWRRAGVGILACLLVGVGVSAAGAQLRAGQVEAGLLVASGAAPGGDQRARYLLLRTLGLLLTDRWDLGVQLGLIGDFETAPSSAVLANAQYLLAPIASITPYVGAQAGVEADLFTAHPRVADAIGPQVGAKWHAAAGLLLIAEIRYTMQVARPGQGVLLLGIGFSLLDEPIRE